MTMSEKYSSESTREQLEAAIRASLDDMAILLEAEAKARCPVDTGRLRDSITTETTMYEMGDEDGVAVYSDVEYAPFVELRAHFLEKAGKKAKTQMLNIVKENIVKE